MVDSTVDADPRFYERMEAFDAFSDVATAAVYQRVPDDWFVLITDVKGSTKAIEAGRYKDVNALGVSTITAVLNSIKDVQFPYVFGGDGATLVVPGTHVEQARAAARSAIALAKEGFDLELRAGLVPVAELTRAGQQVRVGKYRSSDLISMAMFEGGGLAYAEKLVKDPATADRFGLTPAEEPDWGIFNGFECRWKPIKARKDHILSLLVVARPEDKEEQRRIYRRVLEGIHKEAHMGEDSLRPVDKDRFEMNDSFKGAVTEARVRSGANSGPRYLYWLLRTRAYMLLGKLVIRFGLTISNEAQGRFDGATYRRDLAANTDFRKFDDTLRMVIDVSNAEMSSITAYLETERAAGQIAYGTHASDAALMTCIINDFGGNHIHFVDGSNGGYALAARGLKQQLKEPVPTRG